MMPFNIVHIFSTVFIQDMVWMVRQKRKQVFEFYFHILRFAVSDEFCCQRWCAPHLRNVFVFIYSLIFCTTSSIRMVLALAIDYDKKASGCSRRRTPWMRLKFHQLLRVYCLLFISIVKLRAACWVPNVACILHMHSHTNAKPKKKKKIRRPDTREWQTLKTAATFHMTFRSFFFFCNRFAGVRYFCWIILGCGEW